MNKKLCILLGCDRSDRLGSLISLLRNCTDADLVTANRVSDLNTLVDSITPNLTILLFHDNQRALDSLNANNRKFCIPVLCLNKRTHQSEIRTSEHNIVFNEKESLLEDLHNLKLKIRSILLLAIQPYRSKSGAIAKASPSDLNLNNSRNLSRYVMEIEQNNQTLSSIKKRVGELSLKVDQTTRSELVSIVNSINIAGKRGKHWDDFKIYFENINPKFIETLSLRHPCLTPKDLKYCCYLKMNMSNEDIRELLSINSESVRTHKYRLKKKMALSKSQDLNFYIHSLAQN